MISLYIYFVSHKNGEQYSNVLCGLSAVRDEIQSLLNSVNEGDPLLEFQDISDARANRMLDNLQDGESVTLALNDDDTDCSWISVRKMPQSEISFLIQFIQSGLHNIFKTIKPKRKRK